MTSLNDSKVYLADRYKVSKYHLSAACPSVRNARTAGTLVETTLGYALDARLEVCQTRACKSKLETLNTDKDTSNNG